MVNSQTTYLENMPVMAKPRIWDTATEMPKLAWDEVHVWRVCLDDSALFLERLISILSIDEINRTNRYCFLADRNHFIVARGVLRIILGSYLNMKPDKLRFSYSPYNKPLLSDQLAGHVLNFNVSHSHGLGLCAVTRGRELGVDLEKICPVFINEQIPEHFFSPQEVAKLRALPNSLQEKAFFNCWTRKEAFLNAKGGGLSFKLNQFEVSFAPGEPAAILNTYDDLKERDRWSLIDINPGPGYAGALAVEGFGLHLKCFQWETHFGRKI
jgi:4'-phosphopantetheinyl transferase